MVAFDYKILILFWVSTFIVAFTGTFFGWILFRKPRFTRELENALAENAKLLKQLKSAAKRAGKRVINKGPKGFREQ